MAPRAIKINTMYCGADSYSPCEARTIANEENAKMKMETTVLANVSMSLKKRHSNSDLLFAIGIFYNLMNKNKSGHLRPQLFD